MRDALKGFLIGLTCNGKENHLRTAPTSCFPAALKRTRLQQKTYGNPNKKEPFCLCFGRAEDSAMGFNDLD
jgi:hypothetical protein